MRWTAIPADGPPCRRCFYKGAACIKNLCPALQSGAFLLFFRRKAGAGNGKFLPPVFPVAHFVKFNRFSVKALVFLVFRLYNNDE